MSTTEPNARDRRRAASGARRAARDAAMLDRIRTGLEDERLLDRSYGYGSGASRSLRPRTR
jgi:hypothetical protein